MEKKNKFITKTKKRKVRWIKTIKDKKLVIISGIITAIIIYSLYKVIIFIQNPTDTFSVEQGNICQEETTNGYIIREETVIKGSNYKNGMVQIKTEGEKVAKNEPIFRYYSTGEGTLVKKISDLDKKIDKAIANGKNIFDSDIKSLEKQIDEQIFSLMSANNLQIIQETKKDINKSIYKKAKIAGDKSPSGSYLKKLINERSKYENQLNEGAEYLVSPISGVVSYKVDGYEEILTPNNFSNLTKDCLNSLNLKTGEFVADSKESGKIINNFKCYIVCILDSKQAIESKLGNKVKLRLPNNSEVIGKIGYISEEDKDNIIVFEISEQVQELISYRKVSFDIVWWRYSGKKVPNEAIAEEQREGNKINYVIRTRAGYKDKIYIKVLKRNAKYSIIDNYTSLELRDLGYSEDEIKKEKNLTLYDEILKNPI